MVSAGTRERNAEKIYISPQHLSVTISIRKLPCMKLGCRLSFAFYAGGSFSQKIEDTALSSNWLQFGGRKKSFVPFPRYDVLLGKERDTINCVKYEWLYLVNRLQRGSTGGTLSPPLPLCLCLPCPSVSCLFVALSRCFSLILRWARTGSFLWMHYLQYSALGCARSSRRRGSA